jgi:SAM-dependent methyltransferase
MESKRTLSRIISHPRFYEVQRRVLGADRLNARLTPLTARIAEAKPVGIIVDVGGGAGLSRSLWPEGWSYFCIDPDERAISFREAGGKAERAVGDASDLPFPDGFADAVLMKEVSHHLDDEKWMRTLSEVRRILKSDGHFIFLDGVLTPRRWLSLVFWRFDVGRYPRISSDLEGAITSLFEVVSVERFAAIHKCILMLARHRDTSDKMRFHSTR